MFGTLSGTYASGVPVTNQSGGTIAHGSWGVYISGAGTVSNAGYILGTSRVGVQILNSGYIFNSVSGIIKGGSDGIYVKWERFNTTPNTVINAGSIYGAVQGVRLMGDGQQILTNNSTGLISGGSSGVGIYVNVGSPTIQNYGTVSGFSGIVGESGGSVYNHSGGTIAGINVGIGGNISQIINGGSIFSTQTSTNAIAISGYGGLASLTNPSYSPFYSAHTNYRAALGVGTPSPLLV